MNILHIAPIGHHAEGIGSVLLKLCPEQTRLGHDVRVVSIFPNKVYKNWSVKYINSSNTFVAFIQDWKPDLVIFHSHFHMEYISYGKILRKQGIPYCVQLHGALSKENYKKNHLVKMLSGLLFFNSFLKHASTILYLNKAEYENSIVPDINPKYELIPNGCDTPLKVNLLRDTCKPLKIVYIGRISFEHKGIDVLLKAIEELEKEDNHNYHISFYGNPDDANVNLLVQTLKDKSIASFEGGIYGKDKDELLKKTDVFILTSRYEGMPMGVLEAWSYGIPCILTSGTNMIGKDTFRNAFWETQLNPLSICETVKRAVKSMGMNPTLYRMASYKESLKYGWNIIAKQSIETYKRAIQ